MSKPESVKISLAPFSEQHSARLRQHTKRRMHMAVRRKYPLKRIAHKLRHTWMKKSRELRDFLADRRLTLHGDQRDETPLDPDSLVGSHIDPSKQHEDGVAVVFYYSFLEPPLAAATQSVASSSTKTTGAPPTSEASVRVSTSSATHALLPPEKLPLPLALPNMGAPLPPLPNAGAPLPPLPHAGAPLQPLPHPGVPLPPMPNMGAPLPPPPLPAGAFNMLPTNPATPGLPMSSMTLPSLDGLLALPAVPSLGTSDALPGLVLPPGAVPMPLPGSSVVPLSGNAPQMAASHQAGDKGAKSVPKPPPPPPPPPPASATRTSKGLALAEKSDSNTSTMLSSFDIDLPGSSFPKSARQTAAELSPLADPLPTHISNSRQNASSSTSSSSRSSSGQVPLRARSRSASRKIVPVVIQTGGGSRSRSRGASRRSGGAPKKPSVQPLKEFLASHVSDKERAPASNPPPPPPPPARAGNGASSKSRNPLETPPASPVKAKVPPPRSSPSNRTDLSSPMPASLLSNPLSPDNVMPRPRPSDKFRPFDTSTYQSSQNSHLGVPSSQRTLAPDLDGAKSNGGAFLVQHSHTQLMSLSAFGGMTAAGGEPSASQYSQAAESSDGGEPGGRGGGEPGDASAPSKALPASFTISKHGGDSKLAATSNVIGNLFGDSSTRDPFLATSTQYASNSAYEHSDLLKQLSDPKGGEQKGKAGSSGEEKKSAAGTSEPASDPAKSAPSVADPCVDCGGSVSAADGNTAAALPGTASDVCSRCVRTRHKCDIEFARFVKDRQKQEALQYRCVVALLVLCQRHKEAHPEEPYRGATSEEIIECITTYEHWRNADLPVKVRKETVVRFVQGHNKPAPPLFIVEHRSRKPGAKVPHKPKKLTRRGFVCRYALRSSLLDVVTTLDDMSALKERINSHKRARLAEQRRRKAEQNALTEGADAVSEPAPATSAQSSHGDKASGPTGKEPDAVSGTSEAAVTAATVAAEASSEQPPRESQKDLDLDKGAEGSAQSHTPELPAGAASISSEKSTAPQAGKLPASSPEVSKSCSSTKLSQASAALSQGDPQSTRNVKEGAPQGSATKPTGANMRPRVVTSDSSDISTVGGDGDDASSDSDIAREEIEDSESDSSDGESDREADNSKRPPSAVADTSASGGDGGKSEEAGTSCENKVDPVSNARVGNTSSPSRPASPSKSEARPDSHQATKPAKARGSSKESAPLRNDGASEETRTGKDKSASASAAADSRRSKGRSTSTSRSSRKKTTPSKSAAGASRSRDIRAYLKKTPTKDGGLSPPRGGSRPKSTLRRSPRKPKPIHGRPSKSSVTGSSRPSSSSTTPSTSPARRRGAQPRRSPRKHTPPGRAPHSPNPKRKLSPNARGKAKDRGTRGKRRPSKEPDTRHLTERSPKRKRPSPADSPVAPAYSPVRRPKSSRTAQISSPNFGKFLSSNSRGSPTTRSQSALSEHAGKTSGGAPAVRPLSSRRRRAVDRLGFFEIPVLTTSRDAFEARRAAMAESEPSAGASAAKSNTPAEAAGAKPKAPAQAAVEEPNSPVGAVVGKSDTPVQGHVVESDTAAEAAAVESSSPAGAPAKSNASAQAAVSESSSPVEAADVESTSPAKEASAQSIGHVPAADASSSGKAREAPVSSVGAGSATNCGPTSEASKVSPVLQASNNGTSARITHARGQSPSHESHAPKRVAVRNLGGTRLERQTKETPAVNSSRTAETMKADTVLRLRSGSLCAQSDDDSIDFKSVRSGSGSDADVESVAQRSSQEVRAHGEQKKPHDAETVPLSRTEEAQPSSGGNAHHGSTVEPTEISPCKPGTSTSTASTAEEQANEVPSCLPSSPLAYSLDCDSPRRTADSPSGTAPTSRSKESSLAGSSSTRSQVPVHRERPSNSALRRGTRSRSPSCVSEFEISSESDSDIEPEDGEIIPPEPESSRVSSAAPVPSESHTGSRSPGRVSSRRSRSNGTPRSHCDDVHSRESRSDAREPRAAVDGKRDRSPRESRGDGHCRGRSPSPRHTEGEDHRHSRSWSSRRKRGEASRSRSPLSRKGEDNRHSRSRSPGQRHGAVAGSPVDSRSRSVDRVEPPNQSLPSPKAPSPDRDIESESRGLRSLSMSSLESLSFSLSPVRSPSPADSGREPRRDRVRSRSRSRSLARSLSPQRAANAPPQRTASPSPHKVANPSSHRAANTLEASQRSPRAREHPVDPATKQTGGVSSGRVGSPLHVATPRAAPSAGSHANRYDERSPVVASPSAHDRRPSASHAQVPATTSPTQSGPMDTADHHDTDAPTPSSLATFSNLASLLSKLAPHLPSSSKAPEPPRGTPPVEHDVESRRPPAGHSRDRSVAGPKPKLRKASASSSHGSRRDAPSVGISSFAPQHSVRNRSPPRDPSDRSRQVRQPPHASQSSSGGKAAHESRNSIEQRRKYDEVSAVSSKSSAPRSAPRLPQTYAPSSDPPLARSSSRGDHPHKTRQTRQPGHNARGSDGPLESRALALSPYPPRQSRAPVGDGSAPRMPRDGVSRSGQRSSKSGGSLPDSSSAAAAPSDRGFRVPLSAGGAVSRAPPMFRSALFNKLSSASKRRDGDIASSSPSSSSSSSRKRARLSQHVLERVRGRSPSLLPVVDRRQRSSHPISAAPNSGVKDTRPTAPPSQEASSSSRQPAANPPKRKGADAAAAGEPRPEKKRRKNCAYAKAQAFSEQFFSNKGTDKSSSSAAAPPKRAPAVPAQRAPAVPPRRTPEAAATPAGRRPSHTHAESAPSHRSRREVAGLLHQQSTAASSAAEAAPAQHRPLKRPAGRLRVAPRRPSDADSPRAADPAAQPQSSHPPRNANTHEAESGFAFPRNNKSHVAVGHERSSGQVSTGQTNALQVHSNESQPFVRELLGLPPRKLSPKRVERLKSHQHVANGEHASDSHPSNASSSGGHHTQARGSTTTGDRKRRRTSDAPGEHGAADSQKRLKSSHDSGAVSRSSTKQPRHNVGRASPEPPVRRHRHRPLPPKRQHREETFDEILSTAIDDNASPSARQRVASDSNRRRGSPDGRKDQEGQAPRRSEETSTHRDKRKPRDPDASRRDGERPKGRRFPPPSLPPLRADGNRARHEQPARAAGGPPRGARDSGPHPAARDSHVGRRRDSYVRLPTHGAKNGTLRECSYFPVGRCAHGSKCKHLHLAKRPRDDHREVCINYYVGVCHNGARCHRRHVSMADGIDDRERAQRSSNTAVKKERRRRSVSNSSSSSYASSSSSSDSDDERRSRHRRKKRRKSKKHRRRKKRGHRHHRKKRSRSSSSESDRDTRRHRSHHSRDNFEDGQVPPSHERSRSHTRSSKSRHSKHSRSSNSHHHQHHHRGHRSATTKGAAAGHHQHPPPPSHSHSQSPFSTSESIARDPNGYPPTYYFMRRAPPAAAHADAAHGSPSRSPSPSRPTLPAKPATSPERDTYSEARDHQDLSLSPPNSYSKHSGSGQTSPDDEFSLSQESDFEVDDLKPLGMRRKGVAKHERDGATRSLSRSKGRSHSRSSLCTLPDKSSRVSDFV